MNTGLQCQMSRSFRLGNEKKPIARSRSKAGIDRGSSSKKLRPFCPRRRNGQPEVGGKILELFLANLLGDSLLEHAVHSAEIFRHHILGRLAGREYHQTVARRLVQVRVVVLRGQGLVVQQQLCPGVCLHARLDLVSPCVLFQLGILALEGDPGGGFGAVLGIVRGSSGILRPGIDVLEVGGI
jgi:hypothetical protein